MSEVAFRLLDSSHAGPGWTPLGFFGFYIHRNRCYLQGELENTTGAGRTLLVGLIPATVDTHITLHADIFNTHDVATPGITVPLTYGATVTTAGELVLDALPPYAAAAPGSPYTHERFSGGWSVAPDFSSPLSYTIVLGDESWPILPDLTDTPRFFSFAPYLNTGQFTDIDSEYAVSDARVLLRGRVRAIVDAPDTLSSSLPVATQGALSPSLDSYAVAHGPDGHVILDLETPFAFVEEDIDSRPAAATWSVTRPVPFAGLRALGSVRSQVALAGPPAAQNGPSYQIQAIYSWDNGFYSCASGRACHAPGPSGLVSIDLNAILATYYPAPSWFTVVAAASDPFSVATTFAFPYENGCVGGVCGPEVFGAVLSLYADVPAAIMGPAATPVVAAPMAYTNTSSVGTYDFNDPFGGSSDSGLTTPLQFVHPGAAAEYAGDPMNPNSPQLWRPGEINSVTLELSGDTYRGELILGLWLTPYWDYAESGLRAADVLTLDGAGWQAQYAPVVPTNPPGDLAIGDAAAGVRRLPTWRRQATYPR